MILKSVLFGNQVAYRRMADVFLYSARLNSPNTRVEMNYIYYDDRELTESCAEFMKEHDAWIDNARKTKHHHDIIQVAKNGTELCLIDSDMMILGDMSTIMNKSFDICLTDRRGQSQFPINSGVVFVRVSDKVKAFYSRWYQNVCRLMRDEKLMAKWHLSHGGINQAALGLLLKEGHDLNLKYVPCTIWNCTSDVHDHFDPEKTKAVHINGKLRRLLVYGGSVGGDVTFKLAGIWRSYERQIQISKRQVC